ncbi:MAG: DUF1080 domain-containing protein [Planctomycetia bacterium]|nr:DUF1080 domain-containing protein [Planctomycetia bacterium]
MTRPCFARGGLTRALLRCGLFLVFCSLAVAHAAGPTDPPAAGGQPNADGWASLFNGHDLSGWKQLGGTAKYTVADGAIVGTTTKGSLNSFLCTEQQYGDFELELECKVDSQLNSGVQIRSATKPEYMNGRVHGYQVELATDGNAGFIYDEARRGWLSSDRSNEAARAAFKDGQWNRLRVVCRGDSIKTWVNGVPVADLKDNMSGRGFIALQVHAVLGDPHWQVRFRDVRLKPL